jgi:hypothetical protein
MVHHGAGVYYLHENILFHTTDHEPELSSHFSAQTHVLDRSKLVPLPHPHSYRRAGHAGPDDEVSNGQKKRFRLTVPSGNESRLNFITPRILPDTKFYVWLYHAWKAEIKAGKQGRRFVVTNLYQCIDDQTYMIRIGTSQHKILEFSIAFFQDGSTLMTCQKALKEERALSCVEPLVKMMYEQYPTWFETASSAEETYYRDRKNEWHLKNYEAFVSGKEIAPDAHIKKKYMDMEVVHQEPGVGENGMEYVKVRYVRRTSTKWEGKVKEFYMARLQEGRDPLYYGLSRVKIYDKVLGQDRIFFFCFFKRPVEDDHDKKVTHMEHCVDVSDQHNTFAIDNDSVSSVSNKMITTRRVYTVLFTDEKFRQRELTTVLYLLMRVIYARVLNKVNMAIETFPIPKGVWIASDNFAGTMKVMGRYNKTEGTIPLTKLMVRDLYEAVPTVKLHNRNHQLEPVTYIRDKDTNMDIEITFKRPEVREWSKLTKGYPKGSSVIKKTDDTLSATVDGRPIFGLHYTLTTNDVVMVVEGLMYSPFPSGGKDEPSIADPKRDNHLNFYAFAESILDELPKPMFIKERWVGDTDFIKANYDAFYYVMGEEKVPSLTGGVTLHGETYPTQLHLAVATSPSARLWWAVGQYTPFRFDQNKDGVITIAYRAPAPVT